MSAGHNRANMLLQQLRSDEIHSESESMSQSMRIRMSHSNTTIRLPPSPRPLPGIPKSTHSHGMQTPPPIRFIDHLPSSSEYMSEPEFATSVSRPSSHQPLPLPVNPMPDQPVSAYH
uniref:Uncharacterized protein n=1 Tax=Ditylenchus dipsaci TaxID=166011 RepID=A0A915EGD0_9BILA